MGRGKTNRGKALVFEIAVGVLFFAIFMACMAPFAEALRSTG